MKKIFPLFVFLSFFFYACAASNKAATQASPATLSTQQAETPTANVAVPTAVPTETHVVLNVDADVLQLLKDQNALNPDGSVSSANKYVENNADFSVSPETIKHVTTTDTALKDILSGTDSQGNRVFWNKEKGYWVQEFGMGAIDKTPSDSPFVPLDAYYDGSSHYSAAIYIAEHPNLIAGDAAHPYFKAIIRYTPSDVSRSIFYICIAQEDIPSHQPGKTDISYKINKPFAYLGLQQTKDHSGQVIYVMAKDSWNPTDEHPDQTLPTFLGFDKATYEDWAQYPTIFNITSNKTDMGGEVVPIFPSPELTDINALRYENQDLSPNVAHLQNQQAINLFAESADIQAIFDQIAKGETLTTSTNFASLSALPPELSNMLLLAGVRFW